MTAFVWVNPTIPSTDQQLREAIRRAADGIAPEWANPHEQLTLDGFTATMTAILAIDSLLDGKVEPGLFSDLTFELFVHVGKYHGLLNGHVDPVDLGWDDCCDRCHHSAVSAVTEDIARVMGRLLEARS